MLLKTVFYFEINFILKIDSSIFTLKHLEKFSDKLATLSFVQRIKAFLKDEKALLFI